MASQNILHFTLQPNFDDLKTHHWPDLNNISQSDDTVIYILRIRAIDVALDDTYVTAKFGDFVLEGMGMIHAHSVVVADRENSVICKTSMLEQTERQYLGRVIGQGQCPRQKSEKPQRGREVVSNSMFSQWPLIRVRMNS